MFGPIDPPGGSPQQRLSIDGINGTTRNELSPLLGQLARGNPRQGTPNGFNPGGPMQRPGADILQQLIQHHTQQLQLLQGLHPSAPGSDEFIGNGQDLQANQFPLTHFNQVHAAQNLARFLAGQHTAGLRRYNGRN